MSAVLSSMQFVAVIVNTIIWLNVSLLWIYSELTWKEMFCWPMLVFFFVDWVCVCDRGRERENNANVCYIISWHRVSGTTVREMNSESPCLCFWNTVTIQMLSRVLFHHFALWNLIMCNFSLLFHVCVKSSAVMYYTVCVCHMLNKLSHTHKHKHFANIFLVVQHPL